VDLYIHSPIRLHGVVLNYLSRGQLSPHFTALGDIISFIKLQSCFHFDKRGTWALISLSFRITCVRQVSFHSATPCSFVRAYQRSIFAVAFPMGADCSSKTFVPTYQTTRHHNPQYQYYTSNNPSMQKIINHESFCHYGNLH
jgi:hypothetical protein